MQVDIWYKPFFVLWKCGLRINMLLTLWNAQFLVEICYLGVFKSQSIHYKGIPYDRDENANLEPFPQPTIFCFSRLSLGKFNCSPSSSDPPLLCNHLLLKFWFADNLLPPPPPSHMSNLSVCLWGRGFALLQEDLANYTGTSFEIFRSGADILVL